MSLLGKEDQDKAVEKMKKESEILEFKKSVSGLKEGIISIVAILNKHKKGELYIGIDSKGKTTKQRITEKTLRDISQTVSNHIEPKIYPEVKEVDGHIKISFEGHEIPYFAYGRAYIRVADEDKQLSAKELENMILRKEQTKWDSKPSRLDISQINNGAIAELFTAQELTAYSNPREENYLHYWHREAKSSNAEIDFVIEKTEQ